MDVKSAIHIKNALESIFKIEDTIPLTTERSENVCKVTVRDTEMGQEALEADSGRKKKRTSVSSTFLGVIWMIYSLLCVIKDWQKNRMNTLKCLPTQNWILRRQWLTSKEIVRGGLHSGHHEINERRAADSAFWGAIWMIYSLVCVKKGRLRKGVDSLPVVDNGQMKKRILTDSAFWRGLLVIYSSMCVLWCWLMDRMDTLPRLPTKDRDWSHKTFFCRGSSMKIRWVSLTPLLQTRARFIAVVLRKMKCPTEKQEVFGYSENEMQGSRCRDPDICEVVKWTQSGQKQHRDPDVCEVIKWILYGIQ